MSESERAELLAADSFRVRLHPSTGVAEVRGWELHRSRFARTVIHAMPGAAAREAKQRPLDRVVEFIEDAISRIAVYGEGFPRLELWGEPDPELRLSLRPLPELRDSIELRTAGDIRLEHPDRKGPNIARLAELNQELGCEALLLDREGRVLEGATTSLVWWRGAKLCAAADAARVSSIAEALVIEAARARGLEFELEDIAGEDLTSHEVWAVNALHGIRPVTHLDGTPLHSPDESRLNWFRDALDRTWQPIARP